MREEKIDEKIRRQYEVEKELASKLKRSSWNERKVLYKTLYDELFKKIPWHPRLIRKENEEDKQIRIQQQLQVLRYFITNETVFLEVGSGDCGLALQLAKQIERVYAVDISDDLIRERKELPSNFHFVLSDGRSIDVPRDSIDVAYSYQVIEHFHPEDLVWHIRNIRNALKPGGIYISLTPHRFKGPSDVSKYFDTESTGLHLKEWTFSELIDIFQINEYANCEVFRLLKGRKVFVPSPVIRALEYCIGNLPYNLRKKVANVFLGGRYFVVARK